MRRSLRIQERMLAVAVMLASGGCLPSALADGLVSAQHGASGVSITLFGAGRKAPAATAKIRRLTLGAQRRGFFRVGILPQAQAESLEIRFRVNNRAALSDLPASFATLVRTDAISVRDLAIYLAGEEAPALRAERAEIDGDDPWTLHAVVLADGTKLPVARMEIAGPHAGRITREDSRSPERFHLFPVHTSAPPIHEKTP